jgi:hypothetical protein
MKTFKRIDLVAQAILVVVFAFVLLIKRNTELVPTYLQVVGGWQILSLIIHAINRWHPYKGGRRYNFQLVLAGFVIILFLILFIEPLFVLAHYITIIFMLLPLYYLWVCYMEVFYYNKRPLELI